MKRRKKSRGRKVWNLTPTQEKKRIRNLRRAHQARKINGPRETELKLAGTSQATENWKAGYRSGYLAATKALLAAVEE